jgi:tetratricopeptide (TPR) repeat protein
LAFEDLGNQEVKNIPKPVWVFRVQLDTPGDGGRLASAAKAKRTPRGPLAAGGALVLLLIAGTLVWRRPWEDREEPASVEAMALPLPDKPSIAVLAFANLSDDPEQEYFADGMAEEVITDLSKIPGLFVIARNSSLSYKGLNVKVRQVAEELGVRYVLEGSVRRADEAAEAIERAIRLDPFHLPNYLEWLGDAYLLLGRYDDCIRTTERGVALDPDFVALHVVAAECYAALGNEDKAREAGAGILRTNPRFTLKAFASYVPFTYTSDLELKVGLLRMAGIPE